MKNILFTILLGLSMICHDGIAMAEGVKEKDVEVLGHGTTREEAIKDGLSQAVGQVLGVSLSAQDISSKVLEANSQELSSDALTARETQIHLKDETRKRINTKSEGNIKSYTVLSEELSPLNDGSVNVRLLVTVSYFEAGQQTQRKRMAVLPFRPLTESREEALFLVQLNQAVTDYITQTRNFAVVDRQYLQEKFAEFNLLQGDDVRPEERARIGSTIGTDYILVGSDTSFTATVQQKKVPYVNETRLVASGRASLAWRLIHAPTGQIVASGVQDEKFSQTMRDAEDFDWLARLSRPAGEKIGRKIVDIIYPAAVVACQNGIITIARGGDTMKTGQRFYLIKYCEGIMDPYTGEPLAREEIRVGEVEIIDVSPKLSHAKVIRTSVELSGLEPRQYILRPLQEQPKKPSRPATMTPKW